MSGWAQKLDLNGAGGPAGRPTISSAGGYTDSARPCLPRHPHAASVGSGAGRRSPLRGLWALPGPGGHAAPSGLPTASWRQNSSQPERFFILVPPLSLHPLGLRLT